jgi:hypothetical protein
LEDLAYRLKRKDIDTIIKYKSGSTTERQGISFQLGKHVFKGSKVDRSYSLGRLEQKLLFHRQMRMAKRDVLTAYQPSSNSVAFPTSPFRTTGAYQPQESTNGAGEVLAKGMEEIAGNLLRPVGK